MEPYQFSGYGTLYSFCGLSSKRDDSTLSEPRVFGLVETSEGKLILAQLTDVWPEQVKIGMPLRMVIRRIGSSDAQTPSIYAYKFHPDPQ